MIETITNIIHSIEQNVLNVFQVAFSMIATTGIDFTSIVGVIFGILLFILYITVITLVFGKVMIAGLRLVVITLLSPFIAIHWFVAGWDKSMGSKAIKTIFTSVIILMLSGSMTLILVYGVSQINTDSVIGSNILHQFLPLVIFGGIATAFLIEANNIANALADRIFFKAEKSELK